MAAPNQFAPVTLDYFSGQTPPMFQGRYPVYTGPLNFGYGGGEFGQMASLATPFLGGPLQQLMSRSGMIPAQFLPMQNMWDQHRSAQLFQSRQRAMQMAAQTDSQTYQQIFQGIARAQGTPWGLRQQQAAATMSQDIASIAPFVSQFAPELFDQLHGRRGSAVVMAGTLDRLGRHAIDPVTGRIGLSGDTTGTLAQEIFRQRFGSGSNLADMHGFGAGESSLIYEQLAMRGMAAPSIGRMDRFRQVRELADMQFGEADVQAAANRTGRSVSDIRSSHRQLQTMRVEGELTDVGQLDRMPGVDDMMRTFDARAVGNRMKSLTGVVSAMRDVFGDMGRPDAPIRELIDGLEALTQGGLATMSPGRLESLVHETRALAQKAGVTMDTVYGLTAQAAQVADSYGLDRGYVPQAVQNSLAFGQGMGTAGRLDMPAFGSLNREQATLLNQQLTLSAARSPAANQLGSLMRMVDEGVIGTRDGRGNLTEAGRLADAIRSGQSTYLDASGQRRSVAMSHGQFMGLMGRSGVGSFDAATSLRASHANQEYGQRYGIADIMRDAQSSLDVQPLVRRALAGGINQVTTGLGITGGAGVQFSRDVAGDTARAMLAMTPEEYRDTGVRNKTIARAFQTSLAARVRSRAIAGGKDAAGAEADVQAAMASLGEADGDGIRSRSLTVAAQGWGTLDQIASKTAYRSGVGLLQTQGDTVKHEASQARAEARSDAAMYQAMSGLGRAGPLRRLMDAVIDVQPGESWERMLAKVAGGVDIGDLDTHDPLLRSFLREQSEFGGAERANGQLTVRGLAQRSDAARYSEAMIKGGTAADRLMSEIQKSLKLEGPQTADSVLRAIDASDMDPGRKELLRGRVRGLDAAKSQNLVGWLESRGHIVGRELSQEAVDITHDRAMRAAEGISALKVPAGDRSTWRASDAYGDTSRKIGLFLGSSQERVGQFLGSIKDMEHLGRGGLALMHGIEGRHGDLQALADKAGVSVDRLLMGDVDAAHSGLVIQARKLHDGLRQDWSEVLRRQAGTGPKPGADGAMTDKERLAFENERQFRTMAGSPAEQAKAQAESLADEIISLMPKGQRAKFQAGRGDLVSTLMGGDRMSVFRALQTQKGGGSTAFSALGSASADSVDEVSDLLRREMRSTTKSKVAEKQESQVTGTLKLIGLDKVVLSGQMSSASLDSAPIMADE